MKASIFAKYKKSRNLSSTPNQSEIKKPQETENNDKSPLSHAVHNMPNDEALKMAELLITNKAEDKENE